MKKYTMTIITDGDGIDVLIEVCENVGWSRNSEQITGKDQIRWGTISVQAGTGTEV